MLECSLQQFAAPQLKGYAFWMGDGYVHYSDGIETLQPGEAELIEKIVASMARVNRKVFDKHRHATRDAHAKTHGVLVGTLTVYDALASHLRQGLFRHPKSYPIVVRFSSAHGDIHGDRVPALRGMAIKIIGVEGRKVLSGYEGESTQDFLLVNQPVIPFGHVAAYWKMQQRLEKRADDSESRRATLAGLARGAVWALKLLGIENHTLAAVATPHYHILGETFHSMAALRFGDYVSKISAAPLSSAVRNLTGQIYDPTRAPSIVRDQVVAFFKEQGAEFELRAQLCTDLGAMPVEDASIVWSESRSPQQPIAKLSLPAQDAYSPARRVYADDVLSFTPWHCIPEHRPLGSIMRARIKAYESSAAFRHAMNSQPRSEPRSIDEIPA